MYPNAGIWMKVPTFGDGIDLYKNNNFRRKFKVGKDGHTIEFRETDDELDEVTLFLN
jgi:hypothetical protein